MIYQTTHNDYHVTVSDYCLHFLGYNGHIDALVSEPCAIERMNGQISTTPLLEAIQ